ncbi:CHAT domain-containing protein [Lactarius quietus]|nr:CHAT domain-containing protein [Lactarius quietus]
MAGVPPRSINEIDSDITQYERGLSIIPRSDPRRPLFLYDLALRRLDRFLLSNQREDLDKSICHFTESILLLPFSWLECDKNFLAAFHDLADALLRRSLASKQPRADDAVCAAKHLLHLRDQPNEISGISRHRITRKLVDALAMQAALETGNMMKNIREIAVLCSELFNLTTSCVNSIILIKIISRIVASRIRPFVPDQPLDELIECLQAARKHIPDILQANGRFTLGRLLTIRYFMTYVNDDCEEAMSMLDEFIAYSFAGDGQEEANQVAQAQLFKPFLALFRSMAYESPEYLEEAIYRTRAFVAFRNSNPIKGRSYFVLDPEFTAGMRCIHFGSIEGLEALDSLWRAGLTSVAEEGGEYFRIKDEMGTLLLWIRNNDDTTKIDEVIKKGRTLLASYSPTTFPLTEAWLFDTFADILFVAFSHTKKIEYLNESISTVRQAIARPFSQLKNHIALPPLARRLIFRATSFPGYRAQDVDEALELFSQCVSDAHASLPERCYSACEWAYVARYTRHPSLPTAYKSALSLMQDTPLFSPTLQLQHTTLVTREHFHDMPLDYASYQVDLGQPEEAIETLERGRALLWSQMRRFRTPIDQLLEEDPDLGRKFATVNRELEELTKSIPPSHKLSADDAAADGLRAVDPFGRLLLKQRELLKERNHLICHIQTLPGFDSFLATPSFDTLRSSASSGPVIIINHSIWRSDILILLHNMPPSPIDTPRNFYFLARDLKDKLLGSRHKYGLDSKDYDETLASILAELYPSLGNPSSTDFVSFSRAAGSQSSDRPSILLVAQPDPSLPTVGGEIQVVHALDTEVTSLISAAATPATVVEGFHHHRFVHFACHGTLEPSKPFEARFELYGDERLTLLEIVRAHLPTAEFAFLSACHTAEVTEGSIVDEGLHLAAAVQYCGFCSVVGTMWAMADEDGRDLSKYFYKALFSNSRRDQGIPYYERSAKALRSAQHKLRRKRGITLERWVNFVHYGA